jgi:Transglycosylase SLT domain
MSATVTDLITQAAQSAGVDPALAIAVATRESSLSQSAVGTSGEQGVFQLLPSTARDLGVDPTDVHQNIAGGTALLGHLLAQFGGDEAKALAAYNCGAGCVHAAIAAGGDRWYEHIPSSTWQYVTSILGNVVPDQTTLQAAGTTPDAPAVPPSSNDWIPTGTPAAGPSTGELLALAGVGLLAVLALAG